MLLSSALLAILLTVYFGAWAVSENVDARSLRYVDDYGNSNSGSLDNDAINGVEHTFLFLCPLH